MDVLGVKPMKTQRPFKRTQRDNNNNKGIKVVYISSPMKVKTSASEFRALVQELTGRDSDAERFIETINGKSDGGEGLTIKKEEDRSQESGFGFGFGYGFGFGFSDFLAEPLDREFGNNDSIIFS